MVWTCVVEIDEFRWLSGRGGAQALPMPPLLNLVIAFEVGAGSALWVIGRRCHRVRGSVGMHGSGHWSCPCGFRVRIERPMLRALDAFIAEQPDPRPTRPEAIRAILSSVLVAEDGGAS